VKLTEPVGGASDFSGNGGDDGRRYLAEAADPDVRSTTDEGLLFRSRGQEYGAAIGTHAVADGAGAILDDCPAPCARKPEASGRASLQGVPATGSQAFAWMIDAVVVHCGL
jgi:hypothetical protein